MKGLLIKDLKLIKMQKNFFLTIIVIAVAFTFGGGNLSFSLGFLPFVVSLFSLSTISYDEFDNGNAFLFTLPITRKGYVKEKYLLAFLLAVVSLVLGNLIACVAALFKKETLTTDIIWISLAILCTVTVIQAVMLPFQLKYGAEKARIAIIITVGILFLIGAVIAKIFKTVKLDTTSILVKLSELHIGVLIAAVAFIAALLLLLSMQISTKIVEKKEF